MWVSPFGNLRIEGYLHLPAAYRSLLRPSSALSAKSSTLRSCSLTSIPSATCVFEAFLPLFVCGGRRDVASSLPAVFDLSIWCLRLTPADFSALLPHRAFISLV